MCAFVGVSGGAYVCICGGECVCIRVCKCVCVCVWGGGGGGLVDNWIGYMTKNIVFILAINNVNTGT